MSEATEGKEQERKEEQPAAPSPPPSRAGIPGVWVLVLVLLVLAQGIVMWVRAVTVNKELANRVQVLEAQAAAAMHDQLQLAVTQVDRAYAYAREENYGLKDDAVEDAQMTINAALLFAPESVKAQLGEVKSALAQARPARGVEAADMLLEITNRLRPLVGMAPLQPPKEAAAAAQPEVGAGERPAKGEAPGDWRLRHFRKEEERERTPE